MSRVAWLKTLVGYVRKPIYPYELQSKLLKRCYLEDSMGEHYRVSEGDAMSLDYRSYVLLSLLPRIRS